MFDGLSQIIGFLTQIAQYLINLVESMIMAVVFLASAFTLPQYLQGLMPGIVGSSIICCTAIFVIKFLIGR